MDLLQFRYFLAVINYKNFSAAANSFGVSKSTISRQISALEDELGVTLLNRDTRHVMPTSAGYECMKYAKTILDIEEQALDRIDALESGKQSIFSIASFASVKPFMDIYISNLSRFYPDINTNVDIITFLDPKNPAEYDLCFVPDKAFILPGFSLATLCDSKLCLIVNKKSGNPKQVPFVSINRTSGEAIYSMVKALRRILGFENEITCHYSDYESVLITVNSRPSASIVPEYFVDRELYENIQVIPLDNPEASFTPSVLYNANKSFFISSFNLFELCFPNSRSANSQRNRL
ncbi:MAG: LysR family transcriptional regulator [Lachnospiraceae bacterium]|jgi:LysR family transcriptional activator of glutamate synthase operon